MPVILERESIEPVLEKCVPALHVGNSEFIDDYRNDQDAAVALVGYLVFADVAGFCEMIVETGLCNARSKKHDATENYQHCCFLHEAVSLTAMGRLLFT